MASGADRISDLQEGVLHHILSLLPAQDAVRTCVLAQSWRNRWRSAPAVRFACSTTGLIGVRAFAAFVDGLLRVRLGGPPLDSCYFDLDVVDLDPCCFLFDLQRHGNSWIRRLLELNVRALRFRVSSNLLGQPLELDDAPLSSQHLTRLELTDVDGVDFDFSGCLALQSLKMEASHVWSSEIHSPSLKHLSIKSCCFYVDYRTEMSFPSLVSFEFIRNSRRTPILERMPYLETTKVIFAKVGFSNVDDRCINVRLEDCGDDGCWCCFYYHDRHDPRRGSLFLEGLAEATYLNLSADPDMFSQYVFNRDLRWCPAFNKLKTLVLSKWFLSTDLSPLIWFLHHTPLLEKLTLEIPKSLMETEGSFNPLEKSIVPIHLQIIEIRCKDVDGIVLKVFKVLYTNGIPWWKIRIQCSSCYNFVYTDINK